ncbi:MAG: thiamine phosphate synthase [Nitrospirota bacterium]
MSINTMSQYDLCLITDYGLIRPESLIDAVNMAIDGGVRFIQYRDKSVGSLRHTGHCHSMRESYNIALSLRKLTKRYGVVYIINDDIDIFLAVGADGVHIGQDDIPLSVARNIIGEDKIIGVSTHNLQEAVDAERGGADYIGIGPIFHTDTKKIGIPVGYDIIREIKRVVNIPIYAIGGINESNVQDVIDAGADGVAVISAIWGSDDIKGSAAKLLRLIKDATSFKTEKF